MFCPNCGAQISDTSRFCPSCGNPINSSPQPAPEPPAFSGYQTTPPQASYVPPAQPAAPDAFPGYAASPEQMSYAAPVQAAAPAKAKKKWLLPVLIGGGVLLVGIAVLLIILLSGSKDEPGRTVNDPMEIALICVKAYSEDDIATVSAYAPVNLVEKLRAKMVEQYGSEAKFFEEFSKHYDKTPSNFQDVLTITRDKEIENLKNEYGADYKITMTLNEAESSFYTGEEAKQQLGNRNFDMFNVKTLEGIDKNTVTEYRIYYFDVKFEGSKKSDTDYYKVFMVLANDTWYVLEVY